MTLVLRPVPGAALLIAAALAASGARAQVRTDFRERDNNLRNTAVGEDSASSLRVRCR